MSQLTFKFDSNDDDLWHVEPREKSNPVVVAPSRPRKFVVEQSIGVHATKDGLTAICGATIMIGQGINATLAQALNKLPHGELLKIYTTVPPLIKLYTGGVRLALPVKDESQRVPVKFRQKQGKYWTEKGPLPTGNFNQWSVARLLARHQRVRWLKVARLKMAEQILDNAFLDFTLDEVDELEF